MAGKKTRQATKRKKAPRRKARGLTTSKGRKVY